MKAIRIIAILLLALGMPNLSQSQKLINKELQTENNEKDGFEYKWYLYTYLSGQDTLYAAFDMEGNRITPNSSYIYIYKHRGDKPSYCGGGMFMYWMKKKDATKEYNICTGYNVKGELIFPESMELSFIYYCGDDIFKVTKGGAGNYSGKEAAYNSRGEYIIPFSAGYYSIAWYGKYNCFVCKSKSGSDEIWYTYTRDGQYYAEGFYFSSGSYYKNSFYNRNDPEELAIFNQHKRRAIWREQQQVVHNVSSSTVASSNRSGNSGYSQTTSTTTNNMQSSSLLYSGYYYIDGTARDGFKKAPMPTVFNIPSQTVKVDIYKDHIVFNGSYCKEDRSVSFANEKRYIGASTVDGWGNIFKDFYDVNVKNYDIAIFRQVIVQGNINPCWYNMTKVPDNAVYGSSQYPQQQYQQQYPQQQYQQPQTPEPTRPQTQQPSREKCTWCNGTGEVVKDDAFELGMGGTKYCSKCGKTVSTSHYHAPCPYCHGKGYR